MQFSNGDFRVAPASLSLKISYKNSSWSLEGDVDTRSFQSCLRFSDMDLSNEFAYQFGKESVQMLLRLSGASAERFHFSNKAHVLCAETQALDPSALGGGHTKISPSALCGGQSQSYSPNTYHCALFPFVARNGAPPWTHRPRRSAVVASSVPRLLLHRYTS